MRLGIKGVLGDRFHGHQKPRRWLYAVGYYSYMSCETLAPQIPEFFNKSEISPSRIISDCHSILIFGDNFALVTFRAEPGFLMTGLVLYCSSCADSKAAFRTSSGSYSVGSIKISQVFPVDGIVWGCSLSSSVTASKKASAPLASKTCRRSCLQLSVD